MNNEQMLINDINLKKVSNNNEYFEFDFAMCHGPYCCC